ncbi:hypothetical protein N7493_008314 [Penicillium malachiteum]|uniref:Uncharacterized protein n=1 Tax=Penicillium malachiteum TaxID=1324776 RepID=A0AAD6HHB7_9EURO|nr:hypothetical protein N7493_008314 [Penicillium malachiteum]
MAAVFTIYTAFDRPDLLSALDHSDHPLNQLWPEFLDQDLTFQFFSRFLTRLKPLARFQFLAVETDPATGNESVIGLARSIPFFWPDIATIQSVDSVSLSQNPKILQSLPDGGYDTILARGVQQCLAREGQLKEPLALTLDQLQDSAICRCQDPPNAMSALSITVHPERRKTGLAEVFIRKMKETAVSEQLQALVVPLRPTRKCEYPHMDMSSYINWPVTDGCPVTNRAMRPVRTMCMQGANLPFDPWLRKHLRLGGKVIKVAKNSMTVRGTDAEWRQWTDVNFEDLAKLSPGCLEGNDYIDVIIPSGLVPVQYSRQEKIGIYKEPNVWILHELGKIE